MHPTRRLLKTAAKGIAMQKNLLGVCALIVMSALVLIGCDALNTPVSVEYSVTGSNVTGVSISYTSETGVGVTESSVTLPWTKTVDGTKKYSYSISVGATSTGSGTISITIKADGETKGTASKTEPTASYFTTTGGIAF